MYGHDGYVDHVTRTIRTNSNSHILRHLLMEFEFNGPSFFRAKRNCLKMLMAIPWMDERRIKVNRRLSVWNILLAHI